MVRRESFAQFVQKTESFHLCCSRRFSFSSADVSEARSQTRPVVLSICVVVAVVRPIRSVGVGGPLCRGGPCICAAERICHSHGP